MSDRERFFDDVVAPELVRLRDLCAAHDMPFLAVVEWEPNEYGRSTFHPDREPSASMALAMTAAAAQGNIDAAMIALARRSHRTGHSSLVTKLLSACLILPEVEDALSVIRSADVPTQITIDDVHKLVGHAMMERAVRRYDMASYFMGLAERMARYALRDIAAADRIAEMRAAQVASAAQGREGGNDAG